MMKRLLPILGILSFALLIGGCQTVPQNGQGTYIAPNGDKYVGDFKDGKYDGQGTYTFANGNKYVGEYKDNKRNGQGTFTFADGDKHVGEFKDGKRNGQGTFTFANGDKYIGEYKDDKYNGQGTATFANGDKYEGEFKDNKYNGWGKFVFANGDKYVGQFKNGKYNGQGIGTFADGRRYEGIWENGNFIREAKINFPNLNNNVAANTDSVLAKTQSKLPPCPALERNSTETALDQRLAKWSSCWGRFKMVDVLEGEWLNGLLHGYGTYHHLANNSVFGDKYTGEFKYGGKHGQGVYTFANGDKYVGEFKDGSYDGQGTYIFANGNMYSGEYKSGKRNGQGIEITADGKRLEGIWKDNDFIREAKINLPNLNINEVTNTDRVDTDRNRQQLAEERRRLEGEKRPREQARNNQRINLQVYNTVPASDGSYTITIQTNSDTASLKLNGEELGGRADGVYVVNRVARAGQDTKLDIAARDVYGNTDTKSIVVTRTVTDSAPRYASLDPARVKTRASTDSVAIIIGIQNYKRVPKAEFANSDASAFYDYAIRALGVKPENIKLLLDEQADEVEILAAFKNWLPVKVKKARTDVYVFYSGHGLPSDDGKNMYILPFGADRQFIDKTALNQQEIIAAIQSASPKSVTMFMDACYSGQTRTGDTLLTSARPLALKAQKNIFPSSFTVLSASQADQISSSSRDLQHGIFSYYLMKGMEGEADTNKDGRITAGEMQGYLVENVGRQAEIMNRKQEPQLIGDANRVLLNVK